MKKRALVPENIKDLKAYVPGKTIAEVRKEYKPSRILKLASNENRFGRSSKVDVAVLNALETVHDYPDPEALKLRSAISSRYGITENKVVFGAGSESMLAGLFRSFFLNKENVITSDATFIGVFIQANIRGVKVKKIPISKNFRFDLKAMVNAIDENTKMLYIANPNNPTGTYITKDEFEWLLSVVPRHILIVMDEAYYEYAHFLNDYPAVLSYNQENLIVLRTFSKGYGLAGFRVGYAIADSNVISFLKKTRLAFEPGSLGQAAALAAFEDQDFLKNSVSIVEQGKQELYTFFDQLGITYSKSAANFVMIELPSEKDAFHITQILLEQGVILRHIKGFGLPKCIRITIGLPEEMEHFKKLFKEIIEKELSHI